METLLNKTVKFVYKSTKNVIIKDILFTPDIREYQTKPHPNHASLKFLPVPISTEVTIVDLTIISICNNPQCGVKYI